MPRSAARNRYLHNHGPSACSPSRWSGSIWKAGARPHGAEKPRWELGEALEVSLSRGPGNRPSQNRLSLDGKSHPGPKSRDSNLVGSLSDDARARRGTSVLRGASYRPRLALQAVPPAAHRTHLQAPLPPRPGVRASSPGTRPATRSPRSIFPRKLVGIRARPGSRPVVGEHARPRFAPNDHAQDAGSVMQQPSQRDLRTDTPLRGARRAHSRRCTSQARFAVHGGKRRVVRRLRLAGLSRARLAAQQATGPAGSRHPPRPSLRSIGTSSSSEVAPGDGFVVGLQRIESASQWRPAIPSALTICRPPVRHAE